MFSVFCCYVLNAYTEMILLTPPSVYSALLLFKYFLIPQSNNKNTPIEPAQSHQFIHRSL